jgi:hypothetical protein
MEISTTEEIQGQEGAATEASPAWARLLDQIAWYDRKSEYNQHWFTRFKIAQIVTAAAIPVAAAASVSAAVLGAAGALIVILEGLQQLQQYQQNWIAYRATCERLRHEQFLYLAQAGPYAAATNPEALLAEQVESLVSQENAAWVSQREEANTRTNSAG